jgi:PTS system nitrogen regulatory IIA component
MQLGVKEAANLLDISEKTVYRWINQGFLPAYRVHDQYRFNRAELLEWATSRKINVSPDIFNEPGSSGLPMPGLMESLQSGGIFYRIEGDSKSSVLGSVVEHMRLPDGVDRDFLLRVLLAREELASTGIGNGIAIPHVRNPVVLHVTHPILTLCFLEKPVEYDALDGKPVHALFGLISPTVRAHLHLLSRLSFALMDGGFRSAINRQARREEILGEAARIEKTFASHQIAIGIV